MNNVKPSELKPWLNYYSVESRAKKLTGMMLWEQLRDSSMRHERDVALHYYGNNITYGELMHSIDLYAKSFVRLGVKKGDYVSLISVAIPETIYSIYALNKIGAISNLIDVRTDICHTKEFVAKAQSEYVVILDVFADKIVKCIDELGIQKVIVQSAYESLPLLSRIVKNSGFSHKSGIFTDKRVIQNRKFVAAGKGCDSDAVTYAKDAPAIVTRTGGTTGASKGVVLTNDSINAVYENFVAVYGDMHGESILNFLPIAASYGIVVGIHAALCANLKNILIPKFEPDDFAELVIKYHPNHIVGVPSFYEKLIRNRKAQKMDMSFILTMGSGGDTMHPKLAQDICDFSAKHGIKYPIAVGYGMSESSSACAFGVKNIHKPGSVGIPSRYSELGIFEPGTTNELGFNEVGEICISGATIMKEYLHDPEETAHVMWEHPDSKTWIHSGDLGYIDEDGFLFVNGRIKRSIIRFDGHKNYPIQLENIVNNHPAVSNSTVIGIKDINHVQGELPLVIVELKQGNNPSEKLRKTIYEYCCDNIEKRSIPYDVVIENTMPMTINGKVDISRLTQKYYNYMKGETL